MNEKMDLINKFSRKALEENEVFIFNVTLCDNDIDRDFEAFEVKSLEKLGKLFKGKTGISDHSMRSSDQAARLFNTWIETDFNRKTAYGEPYTALKGEAYMIRTKKNEDLIKEIDGGIKKEVSIGCAVKSNICSVCGKEIGKNGCRHMKGKKYNDKLCYSILKEVTDAYEWSFVAVPSQRAAGVTKSFRVKEKRNLEEIRDLFSNITEELVVTKSQAESILKYLETVEEKVKAGDGYRNELTQQIVKLAMITMPEISSKTFANLCENMDIDTLREFKTGLEKKKSSVLPVGSQLFVKNENKLTRNNSEYKI